MARTRPATTTVGTVAGTVADKLIVSALTIGATARVTRLITRDDFPFRAVRDWALTRYGENAWFTRLIECPWCTGVWVAAPATLSAIAWSRQPWWRALAAWMALSMAASAIVIHTEPHQQ